MEFDNTNKNNDLIKFANVIFNFLLSESRKNNLPSLIIVNQRIH